MNEWKPKTLTRAEKKRPKEGMIQFGNALEQDAKEAAARGSGLPKDWRSRIFKKEKDGN